MILIFLFPKGMSMPEQKNAVEVIMNFNQQMIDEWVEDETIDTATIIVKDFDSPPLGFIKYLDGSGLYVLMGNPFGRGG